MLFSFHFRFGEDCFHPSHQQPLIPSKLSHHPHHFHHFHHFHRHSHALDTKIDVKQVNNKPHQSQGHNAANAVLDDAGQQPRDRKTAFNANNKCNNEKKYENIENFIKLTTVGFQWNYMNYLHLPSAISSVSPSSLPSKRKKALHSLHQPLSTKSDNLCDKLHFTRRSRQLLNSMNSCSAKKSTSAINNSKTESKLINNFYKLSLTETNLTNEPPKIILTDFSSSPQTTPSISPTSCAKNCAKFDVNCNYLKIPAAKFYRSESRPP